MHRVIRALEFDHIVLRVRERRRVRLAGAQRQPLVARRATSSRPDGILLLELVGMNAVEFETVPPGLVPLVEVEAILVSILQFIHRRRSSHGVARASGVGELSSDANEQGDCALYSCRLISVVLEHMVEALRQAGKNYYSRPTDLTCQSFCSRTNAMGQKIQGKKRVRGEVR